jgi:hypothetical protein
VPLAERGDHGEESQLELTAVEDARHEESEVGDERRPCAASACGRPPREANIT